jgi:hypothetical protein
MSKVLFLGALGQNQTLVNYGYNEFRISRIWMRQLFASAGQIVIFPMDTALTVSSQGRSEQLWIIFN